MLGVTPGPAGPSNSAPSPTKSDSGGSESGVAAAASAPVGGSLAEMSVLAAQRRVVMASAPLVVPVSAWERFRLALNG